MERDELRVGNTPARTQVARAGVRALFSLGVWGGLLFWAAGTLSWVRAWFHLSLWIATLAANFAIILWKNPAGLATRMKRPQIGERFDKVIVSCLRRYTADGVTRTDACK
jgi:hypothetical protein